MLRALTLEGKIPDHESFKFEVKNAENRDAAVISFMLSVRRNFKKKDDQYYKDDLIPVKAFGSNAQFIGNNFKKGDFITIEGELSRDDDYTDTNGNKQYGNLYASVNKVHFPLGASNSDKPVSSAAVAKTPVTTKKSGNLAAAVSATSSKKVLPGLKPPAGGLKAPTRASFVN